MNNTTNVTPIAVEAPTTGVTPMFGSSRRAVSRRDAGTMLGVSWKTIQRLIDRGDLQGFKVLGQWRITVEEINTYVARQTTEANRRIGA